MSSKHGAKDVDLILEKPVLTRKYIEDHKDSLYVDQCGDDILCLFNRFHIENEAEKGFDFKKDRVIALINGVLQSLNTVYCFGGVSKNKIMQSHDKSKLTFIPSQTMIMKAFLGTKSFEEMRRNEAHSLA